MERQVKALVMNSTDRNSDPQHSTAMQNTGQNAMISQKSVSKPSAVGAFLHALGHEPSTAGNKRASIAEEMRSYRLLASKHSTATESENTSLQFWSMQSGKLPILASFARRFLATPGTSVPSESAFSTSSYLGRKERSRLTPENLSITVFLKDKLVHE